MNVSLLPTLNATLNTCAAFCLFLGWRAVKAGNVELHKKFMILALLASALFLTSYITYHFLFLLHTTCFYKHPWHISHLYMGFCKHNKNLDLKRIDPAFNLPQPYSTPITSPTNARFASCGFYYMNSKAYL